MYTNKLMSKTTEWMVVIAMLTVIAVVQGVGMYFYGWGTQGLKIAGAIGLVLFAIGWGIERWEARKS